VPECWLRLLVAVFRPYGSVLDPGLENSLARYSQHKWICPVAKRDPDPSLFGGRSCDRGLPVAARLVSPCVKRRSRWPSAPGALILSEVGLNATVRRRPRLLIQASSAGNSRHRTSPPAARARTGLRNVVHSRVFAAGKIARRTAPGPRSRDRRLSFTISYICGQSCRSYGKSLILYSKRSERRRESQGPALPR
jgi:hypothetical protein